MRIGRRLVVAALLSLQIAGCASTYSAKSISTTVTDVDSGQPLEGVIVVAHWRLRFGLEGGSGADMKIMETVTDQQGHFFFPAWGPEPIPDGLPMEARLKGQDPEIILFKQDYSAMALANDRPLSGQAGPGFSVRTSDWDGKTIRMERFKGERRYYASMLDGILTGVSYGGCNFKKLPRLLTAIVSEEQKLRRELRGQYQGLFSLENLQALDDPRCGSITQFLRERLQ